MIFRYVKHRSHGAALWRDGVLAKEDLTSNEVAGTCRIQLAVNPEVGGSLSIEGDLFHVVAVGINPAGLPECWLLTEPLRLSPIAVCVRQANRDIALAQWADTTSLLLATTEEEFNERTRGGPRAT